MISKLMLWFAMFAMICLISGALLGILGGPYSIETTCAGIAFAGLMMVFMIIECLRLP